VSRFPYYDEYEVHRTMPDEGTPREEILAMMDDMASRENVVWEGGHCSGTMYCAATVRARCTAAITTTTTS